MLLCMQESGMTCICIFFQTLHRKVTNTLESTAQTKGFARPLTLNIRLSILSTPLLSLGFPFFICTRAFTIFCRPFNQVSRMFLTADIAFGGKRLFCVSSTRTDTGPRRTSFGGFEVGTRICTRAAFLIAVLRRTLRRELRLSGVSAAAPCADAASSAARSMESGRIAGRLSRDIWSCASSTSSGVTFSGLATAPPSSSSDALDIFCLRLDDAA